MTKSFKLNSDGNIELSKEELNSLLIETYNEGYKNGKSNIYIWHSPYYLHDYNEPVDITPKITWNSNITTTYSTKKY